MLPNVVGPAETCRQIAIYSLLLVAASFGPLLIPGVGLLYGAIAAVCDGVFLWRALALYRLRDGEEVAAPQGGDGAVRLLDPLHVPDLRRPACGGSAEALGVRLATELRLGGRRAAFARRSVRRETPASRAIPR